MADIDSDVSTFDFASGLRHPSPGNPRPLKRRRLANGHKRDSDEGLSDASEAATAIESDFDSLPSQELNPRTRDANDDAGSGENKPAASKRKIYEPKYHTIQDPVFVTQLTQPPSSPSRIRGPRWKKPPPETVLPDPVASPTLLAEHGNDATYSDDDMRAAIAASLESQHEEEPPLRPPNSVQNNSPQTQDTLSLNGPEVLADTSFLDDIPDDAFDTSPDTSPKKNPNNDPILISSQPTRRPLATSQQQNMRQTTLLGGFAQKPKQSSQGVSRSWPLASQAQLEPPSHHRFNPDALSCWIYPANLGERREYQFNIAQRGLYHNLLVALPTGLGKTFIAATVMLNWYRWTSEAQIVFVAPTKPLVSQQVEACFGIVGIPRSATTMLTGEASPGIRSEEWKSKRVFFMTPQTLINDLKSGIADPKKIVLLVVDEAHRATGGYAYTQVVQFLQRFNSSFRVLALTATPGSTVESVQEVIDNLNISRVEIRTETSLDIREYVHSRNVEIQSFENSEEMVMAMELFAKALQPAVDKLRNLNAFWARDPMSLTPYGLTIARQQWMASAAGKNANWGLKGMVNNIFAVLASLAHSVDLLKYHGIGPFYRSLLSFQTPSEGSNNKQARSIADDGNFKIMMSRLRMWTNKEEFVGHPKLEYLRQVILNHFLDAENGGQGNGRNASDTRIMIFSHFRDSAEEITRVLKRHEPIIKPHVFVGRANTKESAGMDQKTQSKIVGEFKAGVYNTIVATSIGEEGLDIGEVDLIVCYDSSSSPIRMLQRMGRTGRKRQGNVVLLLMKGKEEESYTKAKLNYEAIQQMIAKGDRFTYHTDKAPRIIPREIQPVPEEKKIEIPAENSQTDLPEPTKRPGRAPKRPPKKFHMPDGVETGFTKASRIGGSKRAAESSDSDEGGNSDNLDPHPGNLSGEEHAEVPSPSDISITSSQRADLAEELRTAPGNPSVGPPRLDAFPTIQRSLRPTRLVRHGRTTRGMVTALRQIAEMGSDCEENCKKHLRSGDTAHFMSSPDNSPVSRRRRRQAGDSEPEVEQEHEDLDGLLSGSVGSDVSDSFSSLMCSPVSAKGATKGSPEQAQPAPGDDSELSDFDDFLNRLTTKKEQKSRPLPLDEEDVDWDDDDSTPRPSAPRRSRFLISDDSDF